MRNMILGLSLLALVSCDVPPSAEKDANAKYDSGEVTRIAVAPDGTVLWAVKVWGNTVYFASRSTQRSYSCGKGCDHTDHVPTADD